MAWGNKMPVHEMLNLMCSRCMLQTIKFPLRRCISHGTCAGELDTVPWLSKAILSAGNPPIASLTNSQGFEIPCT